MPDAPAQIRAVTFFDGQNLYHSAKSAFGQTTHPQQNAMNKLQKIVTHLRRNWIVLLTGALVGGAATLVGVATNIQALLFPPPNALEVADHQSKQEISREFIRIAWKRLYRSRQFLARIARDASEEEIDAAWRALLESVEEMSSKTMMFAIAFGEIYSDAIRGEFEGTIQFRFEELTRSIVDLRYQIRKKQIQGKDLQCKVAELQSGLDGLNVQLYQFASCFDKRKRTVTGCVEGNASLRMSESEPSCSIPDK
jgi:hypothetical protein